MEQLVTDLKLINMRVALGILQNEKGEFLAISRKYNHNDFGIIGGEVEPNETPYEAVIREIKEETGLTVSDPILIDSRKYRNNEVYCFTFNSICWDNLCLGMNEEGVVALKQESDLYLNCNSYFEYNKDVIDIHKKYHKHNTGHIVTANEIIDNIYKQSYYDMGYLGKKYCYSLAIVVVDQIILSGKNDIKFWTKVKEYINQLL